MKKIISIIAVIIIYMSFSVVSFAQETNSSNNKDDMTITNLNPATDNVGERK